VKGSRIAAINEGSVVTGIKFADNCRLYLKQVPVKEKSSLNKLGKMSILWKTY